MKPMSPFKTGLLPMLAFWFAVMGVLYLLMQRSLQPQQTRVEANGDLVIERARDGHFYVPGRVNGADAVFLVDTGATMVMVGDAMALRAGLQGGVPTTFKTANGDRTGRVVEGVRISVGPMTVSNIRVGVGLSESEGQTALLGQSFLAKFDINLQKDRMVLKARP